MKKPLNGSIKKLPPVWAKKVDRVIDAVVIEFGFDDESDIWERTRVPYRCWARWIVWCLMIEMGLSANQTGIRTGWNYASVSYGVKRLREDIVRNPDIRGIYNRVSANIDGES